MLLWLIAVALRHGYDLIRAIEEISGGAYAPSPGKACPPLTELSGLSYVTANDESGRHKRDALTEAGEVELAANASTVTALNARLTGLLRNDRQMNAPIRRAMDNLKMVLGNSIGQDGMEIHNIAALIDEASQKIERLR